MVPQGWSIVTGANRGLGYEVVKKLAAAGHPVILAARDPDSGAKAAAAVAKAGPGAKVEVLQLDASSAASIEAFVARVAQRHSGEIDLLVNNAGIVQVGSWTPDTHASILRTNLDGALDLTLALLPHLAEGARVVMVASGIGQLPMLSPDYADALKAAATIGELRAAAARFDPSSAMATANIAPSYSVSKAAMIRSAQILAEDPAFKAKGASVVAVNPGWCSTDMGDSTAKHLGKVPPRTAAQGADSILAAADTAAVPSGTCSIDGVVTAWDTPPNHSGIAKDAAKPWAVVTGANRGLGYEVVKKLAAACHPVILTARDPGSGDKAAAAVATASPGAKVEVLQLNASSAASIKAFVASVAERHSGEIGLLINNAGVWVTEWDAASHAACIAANLDGALDLTLAMLPHLAEGARVVMVASGMGHLPLLTPDYADPIKAAPTLDAVRAAAHRFLPDSPMPQHNKMAPSYSVSKAAMIRSAQILADDPAFKAKGVSVVSVTPGWCATDMGNATATTMGVTPPRTALQGADSILAAADKGGVANASFSMDGKERDWTAAPTM